MLLFFVLSLVAGYTGRNLIFEQRIASNQFQSTTSFDAAEAGLDWAISQLNGSRIDDACVSTVDLSRDNFRDRYLTIDPASGVVTPRTGTGGAILWAACVFNGADWVCSCPAAGAPSLTAPVGTGSFPAFAARFEAETGRPGVVRVEVNGCARYDLACLSVIRSASGSPTTNCDSTICALLALNSALRHVPVAALTAGGTVNAGGGPLTVVNAEPASGITARARSGFANDANAVWISAPGTPGDLSKVANDSALLALVVPDTDTCTNCLFAATFGLSPASYRRKQDVVELDCTSRCDASDVRDAAALHPGRTLWLKGPGPGGGLDFDDNTALGSATNPITLIVEGQVLASATAPRFFGVLYGALDGISTVSLGSGAGEWRGALLSAGDVTSTGAATVAFDKPLLDGLRFRQGSFVRVPGSWRDYQ